MTSYIFKNAGVLDPRSITTFGVSSKEGKNPIGFFGTGLKYAIAVLLRNNCKISIISGGIAYDFSVERQRVRADEFDVVTMSIDGAQPVALGFTTQLGKTWALWQAFRELACNAIDENGAYFVADSDMPYIKEDETAVVVTGAAFAEAWSEKDKVILHSAPLVEDECVDMHDGQSAYLYYRGVRAYRLQKPSLFTYNIKEQVSLTEDRTLSHPYYALALATQCIQRSVTSTSMLAQILKAPAQVVEASFEYTSTPVSYEFKKYVVECIKAHDHACNASARRAIQAASVQDLAACEEMRLDGADTARLIKAKKFFTKMGYNVDEFPVVVTEFLGEGVLGQAKDNTIYISKRAFMMGTKMLAGTLFEEYIHLKHNVEDETRSMQNFIIDALISCGERATRMVL